MANWTAEQQKEHRKLWVEALRSGKYQQCTDQLKSRSGAFCCLGLACELSGLGRWDENRAYVVGTFSDDQNIVVPVRDWLGLREIGGEFGDDALWNENDNLGKTFAEIADIIESEPAGLIAPPDEA